MKLLGGKSNVPFDTREGWLGAATDKLRAYFASLDYELPGKIAFAVPLKIRFAVAFPSTGKKGKRQGETWAPGADDGYYEIYLRADLATPAAVLAELTKQLVHAALPPDNQHGKLFRDAAMIVGFKPPMRETTPGKPLQDFLAVIAEDLGPLPHDPLNINGAPLLAIAPAAATPLNLPRKQTARQLKAECAECEQAGKPYLVRISATTARELGPSLCPTHKASLHVHWPKDDPEAVQQDQPAKEIVERVSEGV